MADQTSLHDVFERNQYDIKTAVKKSSAWFEQQVLLIRKQPSVTPKKLMKQGEGPTTGTIKPGNLYMFFYEAKHRETLPYFDRFPLVFPYEKTPDGFMGLNMHYLPYKMRVQLLDKLLQFRSNSRMDENTRLKYSWGLIAGVSKFRAAEPCIKRYLSSQVRSPFKQVLAQDWATAMMLPVESFTGANKTRVWEDSKRAMLS
jgi:hypothetical protein